MATSLRIVCADRKCKGSKTFNFITRNSSLFIKILLQMNMSSKITLDFKCLHNKKNNRKN